MPCKPHIHPENSIRHAYSRYEYVRANTIGVVTRDCLSLLAEIRSASPNRHDIPY